MSQVVARVVTLAVAVGVWFSPVPEGLTPPAWHLFALFAATIFIVVPTRSDPLPSVLRHAVSHRDPGAAWGRAGIRERTILLIVVAFLVARAVVLCGLGRRIAMPW
jgi:DASS family divalent anion:Na+ symporter